MGQFMKKRLLRQLCKRVNCYLALAGKTLNISIRVIEWDALNTQSF